MLNHLSKSPGIGGFIKSSAEDFLVEEIGPDGTLYELGKAVSKPDQGGAFTHFILEKKSWSTASAISEISKRIRTGQNDFNIAGTKDKLAISTQLASVRGDRKQALLSSRIKDISINGAWLAGDRVRLGGLLGNRFTITIRDAGSDAQARIEKIAAELENRMPNYFGAQRFGSTRNNTHLVGQKLLKGEVEEALMMFLCDSEGETNEEARLARGELLENRDFARALNIFPKHLRLERSMLAYLARRPDDLAGAFRQLPRNTLLMFVHAFQSDLFNRLLSDRINEGPLELEEGEYFCGDTLGFPDIDKTEAEGWIAGKLIGYNTPLNDREGALMEEVGMEKDALRMKAMPEISSKGTYRTLLAPLRDFSASAPPSAHDAIVFRFSLPSGSYATVAMREFIKDGS
ncbi:MAG: tRNA pseudouridine(13) synthase TruD [Candidatus Micrarchaeota archaeon]